MTTTILSETIQGELRRMRDLGCRFADARFYDDDATETLVLYPRKL